MTTTWVSPGEDAITASHTAHTAWANGTGWRVSWLGRELDRNQAITAMQIANRIAALDGEPGQDDLALLDTWARELDLTASEVITAVRSTTP